MFSQANFLQLIYTDVSIHEHHWDNTNRSNK